MFGSLSVSQHHLNTSKASSTSQLWSPEVVNEASGEEQEFERITDKGGNEAVKFNQEIACKKDIKMTLDMTKAICEK